MQKYSITFLSSFLFLISKIIRIKEEWKTKSEKIRIQTKKIRVATASQTALHLNFCLSSKVLPFACLFLFPKNVDIFREPTWCDFRLVAKREKTSNKWNFETCFQNELKAQFFLWCSQKDSNPPQWFRRPLCYPLHHGSISILKLH